MDQEFKGLRLRSPDVLETKGSLIVRLAIGLPALWGVILLILIKYDVVTLPGSTVVISNAIAILWGGILLMIAMAAFLGVSKVVLDRGAGTVVKWWGLLVPFRKKTKRLEEIKSVTLREQHAGDSGHVYAVALEADDGDPKPPRLAAPKGYQEARSLAEYVAGFLNKPMVDYSSGVAVERAPDELNESFRERAKRTGVDKDALPPEPLDMKTIVRDQGETAVIELSGMFKVTATASVLKVEEFSRTETKVTEIPVDELEDLEMATAESYVQSKAAPGAKTPDRQHLPIGLLNLASDYVSPGITARSDRASISFGAGLEEDELKFIHALLKKIITQ